MDQLKREGAKNLEEPFVCEAHAGWKVEGFDPEKERAIIYLEDDAFDGGVRGMREVDTSTFTLYDLICIQEQEG